MTLIKTSSPWEGSPHLALIELNRPEVLNAISTEVMKELVTALEELDQNPIIKCLVITGNSRAFAAGADIKQMARADPIGQLNDPRFSLWKRFEKISKPIIAAVDGLALGAGCELALACDLIIASERAKFGQPEIKIGTIPGAGGSIRLARAIGKAKAMKLALTGELVTARKAERWGMVSEVVPNDVLLTQSFQVALEIANKAPIATKLIKENINYSQETSLSHALSYERRNFYLTFASKDQKEGMKAFLEKRPPRYQGI